MSFLRSHNDSELENNHKNSDTPPKKKHKKEHKHKHKKHTVEKTEKNKKHKKHKKHKHKHASPELEVKDDRYTPELSPKPKIVEKQEYNQVSNGRIVKLVTESAKIEDNTDTDNVVNYIASGLSTTHTLEVISSESEDIPEVEECDSDAIDVSMIEADMDLEELMKQKELLQAEIARAENDISPTRAKKDKEAEDEVILLDDSSSDADISISKKRRRSKSRERRIVIERRSYSRQPEKRRERSGTREIRMSRDHRSVERMRSSRDLRRSRSRDNRRSRGRENDYRRSRERQIIDKRNMIRNRHSSHDRFSRSERDRAKERADERRDKEKDRHRSTRHVKVDKYQDSLSEGLKQIVSGSDSDELDIDIKEEDEEAIIEKRRKQREDLLKVCHV